MPLNCHGHNGLGARGHHVFKWFCLLFSRAFFTDLWVAICISRDWSYFNLRFAFFFGKKAKRKKRIYL